MEMKMEMDEDSMETESTAAGVPSQEGPSSIPFPPASLQAQTIANIISPHNQQISMAAASPSPQAQAQTTEELANRRYVSPHCQQISTAEYNRQSHFATQEMLRDLKASTEYKKYTMKCHSCGCSWFSGEFSAGCKECDGHAMHRPCPICHGYCGKMWQRNVDMSHSTGEGHWDGTCGHQHMAKLLKDMIHMDNITDAMEGMRTSETS